MRFKKGGVRGNNRFSKTLNRPIGDRLEQKKSRRFIYILLSIVMAVVWAVSVSMLGLTDGTVAALVISGIVVFGELKVRWQLQESEKIKRKQYSDDMESSTKSQNDRHERTPESGRE